MTDTNIFYYSPSKPGFIESQFHTDIPSDAIEITEAERNAILTEHYKGKDIAVVDGKVVTQDRVLTPEQIKSLAIATIENTFMVAIKSGFTTTSGIKYDADMKDISNLKGAYDLAELTGATTIPVIIDFDNNMHTDYPAATLIQDIRELGTNYQNLFIIKQQAKAALN